ncbi:hypothetical protein LCGC14_1211910, partial [marine sediment metagenome]
ARGPWPALAVWLALAPRPLWARFWPRPPLAPPCVGGLGGGLASPCAAAWLAAPPLWSAPWRPLAPMRRLLAWWLAPALAGWPPRRLGCRVALVRGRRWPWPPASVCLSSFFRLAGRGRRPGPALGRLAPGPAPGAGGLRPASLGFFSVAFFLARRVLLPWWAFFLPCCAWLVASVSTPLGRAPRGWCAACGVWRAYLPLSAVRLAGDVLRVVSVFWAVFLSACCQLVVSVSVAFCVILLV